MQAQEEDQLLFGADPVDHESTGERAGEVEGVDHDSPHEDSAQLVGTAGDDVDNPSREESEGVLREGAVAASQVRQGEKVVIGSIESSSAGDEATYRDKAAESNVSIEVQH